MRLEQAVAARRAPPRPAPTNCRLVKPVSNTKLVAIANSIGLAPSSSSSTRWRAAIATQSFVVIEAVGPVELRGPSARGRASATSGIWVWRSSSSAPKVAVVRQALSRPKRAARRLPTTAANSASGRVAACSLSAFSQARGQLLEIGDATDAPRARRSNGRFLLVLAGDVLARRSCCRARPSRATPPTAARGWPLTSGGKTSSSRT